MNFIRIAKFGLLLTFPPLKLAFWGLFGPYRGYRSVRGVETQLRTTPEANPITMQSLVLLLPAVSEKNPDKHTHIHSLRTPPQ